MRIGKKIVTTLIVFLLLFSIFAATSRSLIPTANSSGSAELTGALYDMGKDTDSDGKFDYLEVGVEINVSFYAFYRVEIASLRDTMNYTYYFGCSNESYLDIGMHFLNVSFYGPKICGNKINASGIGDIRLYENYNMIDLISYAPFSRVYNYYEFECRAVLTGNIFDEGIDTDGDHLYNDLQVGVQINVTEAGFYEMYVSDLYGTGYVSVSNSLASSLSPGLQTMNVTLSGVGIFASHNNVSWIGTISLSIYDEGYWSLANLYSSPLSRSYNYGEFDPLAFLTGTILDVGVDQDSDGLFDYLKIMVELNVTDAGYYDVQFYGLVDNDGYNLVYASQSFGGGFDVGVYLINFTIYGPEIYGAHVNPAYVQNLWLHCEYSPWQWVSLDQRSMVPLSTPYHYYDFESHAFLTGNIHDRGVDTDGDGQFDYLEVGVEVNVTEAGKYGVSVGGLSEDVGNSTWEIGYYQDSENDLNVGIHTINFSFPGPMIAYYHINPTNVTFIYLAEYPYHELGSTRKAALSERYTYTQFDSPLNDMQLEFTVYPNATVEMGGSSNYTNIYPNYYNYNPLVNATVGFSTTEGVTSGSVNGTMIFPKYSLNQFPINSTTASFSSEYYDDMLNARLNATMLMPTSGGTTYPFNSSDLSFVAAYSNGALNIDISGDTMLPSSVTSQFPFNVTDVTVFADYANKEVNGNVTFHAVSGFPIGDAIAYFKGNKTDVSLTGYANVIYGNYYGTEINATTLDQMLSDLNSTYPGRGEHSLYNGTNGMIECTSLNTTTFPLESIGATVSFNATISGNFTQIVTKLLAQMLFGYSYPENFDPIVYAGLDSTLSSVNNASLMLNYYHGSGIGTAHLTLNSDVKALWSNALQLVPPTVPADNRTLCETWLKIANITASAVKSAYIEVNYSSSQQKLNVYATLAANITQLKNETIPLLPDAVPLQFRDFVALLTNVTCAELDSLNTTCNLVNGAMDFDAKWLLKGDFKAELNRIEHCCVDFLALTSPYIPDWQLQLFNSTEVDIDNLKVDVRQSEDWMTLTFRGLRMHLVKDDIDFVRFRLCRFFNMTTSPFESPREFEKLKVTIRGGANATHTVLLYAPSTTPAPDSVSLNYTAMSWRNTTISSLKELHFLIAYLASAAHAGTTYYLPIFTNSTVSNFAFSSAAKKISFNLAGTAGTGFFNITIPKGLLYAAPSDWIVRIGGVVANFTVDENADYAFIYLNYSHSEHLIEIVGTWVVPEYQPNLLSPILAILCVVTVAIVLTQRRKLNVWKTRYQGALNAFISGVCQSRT
jgi:hypothetical protein